MGAASESNTSSGPSPSQLKPLVSFANELADAAREVILPYWRNPIEVVSKLEHDRPVAESPVTVADREAEMAMRRLIEERYPLHGIYGEEFGSVRTDAEYIWVLDPIDGTKSFITGKPLFGTLIACLHHGVPLVGLIDQCVQKERWLGVVGQGTKFNGNPVETAGCNKLSECNMHASTPHMFAPGEEEAKFQLMCNAVKRPLYGSDCYAYALVASGFGSDLVVEADLGLYDYCALVPVVEAAGGVMTSWTGERLTLQNHERNKGRVVACANKNIHEEAVKILGQGRTTVLVKRAFSSLRSVQTLPIFIAGVAVGAALSRRS